MKILWSVNTSMPGVANKLGIKSSHAISWVDAMSDRFRNRSDIQLAIVSPNKKYTGKDIVIENIKYYIISEHPTKNEWSHILRDFNPDVIHLYGTEKSHNLPLLKLNIDIPVIVSLQGILTEYERFYYGGIDISTLIKNITLRDLLRGTVFKERRNFKRNALVEQEMLRSVRYVEGRTEWDRVAALNINNKLKYYSCPRLLRKPFYTCDTWNYNEMIPHTIFVHQGNYPIKGIHFVLEALNILKRRYNDVKLIIAGNDVINKKTIKQKLYRNGYSKYLKSIIDRYQLDNYLEFTGYLDADSLAHRLKKCNVMVIPSAIENSPNSLAEAEILGVPCVASYVGGIPEMLQDYIDGYLYCYNEPGILAEKVSHLFDSREICETYSQNARNKAKERHDPDSLENSLLDIYHQIIYLNK